MKGELSEILGNSNSCIRINKLGNVGRMDDNRTVKMFLTKNLIEMVGDEDY